jgi:mannose-6-phosphate isomerase-like protein (cupin superfamily)
MLHEREMWKVIDSDKIAFKPYRTGVSNIKRIIEQKHLATKSIGGFGLLEVPPGGVFGPHTHPEREEIYYVLSNSGALTIDGDEVPAREGLTLYVSGEEPHGMVNRDDKPLVVVFVTVYK